MHIRIISKALRTISISNGLLQNTVSRLSICGCQQNYYSAKPTNMLTSDVDPLTGEKKKKKTSIIPKITLINGDELNVTTLEEAQRISKRRDLKLVKIVDLDTKTQRPVYKLMTGRAYQAEDLKQREQKKKDKQNTFIKGEKILLLNQNISEHDLQTNVNKIKKWIMKSYEIRVVINGDSNNVGKAEQVYSFLENALKTEARFLQKRLKGNDVKFQILPPKKNNDLVSGL